MRATANCEINQPALRKIMEEQKSLRGRADYIRSSQFPYKLHRNGPYVEAPKSSILEHLDSSFKNRRPTCGRVAAEMCSQFGTSEATKEQKAPQRVFVGTFFQSVFSMPDSGRSRKRVVDISETFCTFHKNVQAMT